MKNVNEKNISIQEKMLRKLLLSAGELYRYQNYQAVKRGLLRKKLMLQNASKK